MGVIETLAIGDQVQFPGYGNGVVEVVSELFIWIRWENGGLLHHRPADLAGHLTAGK